MNEREIYRSLMEKFFDKDLSVATDILEGLPEEDAAVVLQSLPPSLAVRAIRNLQLGYAASLLSKTGDWFIHQVLSLTDAQFAASILMHLPAGERQRITGQIPGRAKTQIRELLEYPEDSVGRIMSADYLSFSKDATAGEAIEKIRMLAQRRFPVSYAYVVDVEGHLIGVLNMRDLMLAAPHQKLESISRKEIFSLHCFTERQAAANELAKRKFFAAPVVDSENHMLGIIKAERMLHGVREDVTKDLQRMFGAGGDERVFSPIGFSLRKRLPWLHVNLATAFLAAAVVAMFEGIIAKLTILAVFLPVVAGQGGNAGAQSLAVVMRGLVMREIPKDKRLALVLKEGKLGLVNGAAIGAVTSAVAYLWYQNAYLGLVIGLGMLVNLVSAGLSGAAIPLLMKRLGIDPAQSSSIILTTVTDVVGFAAFLGFAVMFQQYLT